MLRQNSNSCTKKDHGLYFEIEGAKVSVDEMGAWVANMITFDSEAMMEAFGRDAACSIVQGVIGKVEMAKGLSERARVRREWVKLHPPNHAGYYYCHIGGEWVHSNGSELEHLVPSSVERIDTSVPGWDDKLRMACHQHNFLKGSRQDVPSATLEIAPPDDGC